MVLLELLFTLLLEFECCFYF